MPQNPDMQMTIGVVVSGPVSKPVAQYTLLSSSPSIDPASGVVTASGDIDLRNIPLHPDYSNAIDIVFQLSGTITDGGHALPVIYQTPVTSGCKITRPGGGPTGVLYKYCLGICAASDTTIKAALDPTIVNR
jgi:hypothetical protein